MSRPHGASPLSRRIPGAGAVRREDAFDVEAVAAWLVLHQTPFGRQVYAVGGDPEAARKAGMRTMYEDGIYKALRGVTTIEEVLRATEEA